MKFISSAVQPEIQNQPAWWFAFEGHKLLVFDHDQPLTIPCTTSLTELDLSPVRTQYLGRLNDVDCYSAEIERGTSPPEGMSFLSLRRLFGQMDESNLQVAGRAIQIMSWDRDHQFCGRCATPTIMESDRARVCPNCSLRSYPRISPAVIMRIDQGDKILLAHSNRHPSGMYSVLAGFAEPGETLEETVAREIFEEVGLEVTNVRYFGSQPWPFPNSLMIGFTCDYAGGEIALHDDEIAEADWYTAAEITSGEFFTPPSTISIAGQLIADFIDQHEFSPNA